MKLISFKIIIRGYATVIFKLYYRNPFLIIKNARKLFYLIINNSNYRRVIINDILNNYKNFNIYKFYYYRILFPYFKNNISNFNFLN